jgi:TDG/mug DNA glycosylase family protein
MRMEPYPNASTLATANAIVPDMLVPHLRLVFCGTAPSAISAREKAYYANPNNQFWPVLHRAGITPRQLAAKEYPELLKLGIGLTDLCKAHSGNDDELPPEGIDPEALRAKIMHFAPRLVAFTSKTAGGFVLGRKVQYGLQEQRIGATRLYVCCSTSGRARRSWREDVWTELGRLFHSGDL